LAKATTHPYLLTTALSGCWGLVIYDPLTNSGLLAHVPFADIDYSQSAHLIFSKISRLGIPLNRLQVNIFGGSGTTLVSNALAFKDEIEGLGVNVNLHKIVSGDDLRRAQSFASSTDERIAIEKQTLGRHGLILDLETGATITFANEKADRSVNRYNESERLLVCKKPKCSLVQAPGSI